MASLPGVWILRLLSHDTVCFVPLKFQFKVEVSHALICKGL